MIADRELPAAEDRVPDAVLSDETRTALNGERRSLDNERHVTINDDNHAALDARGHTVLNGQNSAALNAERHTMLIGEGHAQMSGESPHGGAYQSYTSPHNWSMLSIPSEGGMVDEATAKWFDLLAGDASIDLSAALSAPVDDTSYQTNSDLGIDGGALLENLESRISRATFLAHKDDAVWRLGTNLQLEPYEMELFHDFIHNISGWIDLMDPYRHFAIHVPRLAMRNIGLLNAILTLASRSKSLKMHMMDREPHNRGDAITYYHSTLHYVQKAMQYDSYNTSDELLATALIVSAYEMLDGSRRDWERHLQGVFWIQRSQVIHGDSGGLRAAVWWSWLAQDCWAAWREKRRPFTFWRPLRNTFRGMTSWELAARSLFVFARVIGYCADQSGQESATIHFRMQQAEELTRMLDEWAGNLPIDFEPIPHAVETEPFRTIFIHPPAFAVAMQVHSASRILLSLNKPFSGGMGTFIEQQTLLSRCVDQICGIAQSLSDTASSILSSQCLFIAGNCTQDGRRREQIVNLINTCRQRTGWPTKPLEDELRELWRPTT